MSAELCPCGGAAPSGKPAAAPRFADCCGRYLNGDALAPNAFELMRSRYSAYVLGDARYLRASWDPATCPADLEASLAADQQQTRWLGLDIRHYALLDEQHAEVEFVARYKVGGRAWRLQEKSRFVRDADGAWRYVDGEVSQR
jgi:SEC-C motif domain protein